MADKKCANCKFWGGSLDRYPLPNEYNTHKEKYDGWRSCHKMAAECLVPISPPTLAWSFETGETTNQVLTAPEFGCVMWEKND